MNKKKINAEQEYETVEKYRNIWIDHATAPAQFFDEKEMERRVRQLYLFMGYEEPAKVYFANNRKEFDQLILKHTGKKIMGYPQFGSAQETWMPLYQAHTWDFHTVPRQPVLDFHIESMMMGLYALEMYYEAAFVCPKPRYYLKPGTITKHRVDGPAIEYPDGTGMYFIDGIRIEDEQLYWKIVKHQLPYRDILAIKNQEIRALVLRTVKIEEIFDEFGAEKIDSIIRTPKVRGTHSVHVDLYAVPAGKFTDVVEKLLVFGDPSTSKTYFEWVEPHFTRADAAMAKNLKLTVSEYNNLHYES